MNDLCIGARARSADVPLSRKATTVARSKAPEVFDVIGSVARSTKGELRAPSQPQCMYKRTPYPDEVTRL